MYVFTHGSGVACMGNALVSVGMCTHAHMRTEAIVWGWVSFLITLPISFFETLGSLSLNVKLIDLAKMTNQRTWVLLLAPTR